MAGVPPLPTGWPTLTQLRASQFGHLGQFADWCEQLGTKAESALAQLAQKVRAPGGVEWEGAAADAAIAQADTDLLAARPFLWSVPDAAEIARRGQETLEAGKQEALEAVSEAQRAGFRVHEDYSVTDTWQTTTRAQQQERLAEAVAHSNFIRHRVGMLVGNEQRVTAELKEATAGWGSLTFAQAPHRADDKVVGDDGRDNPIQPVDRTQNQDPAPCPSNPLTSVDPRNPFVGDERFGHWENVVPPPYVGNNPPPPWTGHRSLEGLPGKGPARPSGFYTPGGRTWADPNAPPFAYLQEQYRFRISGEDYTSYTRTVNGQLQQWVQYTYEAQRYTQVTFGGSAWAPKGPNEISREPGGVVSGGLAGINPPPKISPWQPITLSQIATLSAANPGVTYYIPNGCGGQFTFGGGVPTGGIQPPPKPPSIVAAH